MNGDKLAVMIEYGHVLNGTGLHDIKDRSSIGVGCDCKKFARHHRHGRYLERAPGQQSTPNVTIGNQADNSAGLSRTRTISRPFVSIVRMASRMEALSSTTRPETGRNRRSSLDTLNNPVRDAAAFITDAV